MEGVVERMSRLERRKKKDNNNKSGVAFQNLHVYLKERIENIYILGFEVRLVKGSDLDDASFRH